MTGHNADTAFEGDHRERPTLWLTLYLRAMADIISTEKWTHAF